MKKKRTSLNDIAQALNVSKATVSFVLNDKGDQFNISKEKQRLIREKAKELLYVPNFFAKSLRQGATKTIGLILPDISNSFYAEICKTIQEKLYDSGYTTLIVNTNDNKEVEKVMMRELIQRGIDGMIIVPSNDIQELIPILLETHIPVVFTDRLGDENADFVGLDNVNEAKKLVNAFSIKPKKLIALCPVNKQISTLKDRVSSLKDCCLTNEIEFHHIELPENKDQIKDLISQGIREGADSFVTLNNNCSLNAYAAINDLGYSIPEDVRLIAFDDNEAFHYMKPPISALSQPITEIGNQSAKRLEERLQDLKEPGTHFILDCTFIPRSTH